MKIKNIEIPNNLFLAPMAGVTDVCYRVMCKKYGAGLTYTEMVSVKGLYYKSKNTEKLLVIDPCEKPCAVQLFGHEPEIFESVIKSGVLDKFDIIDINMGCPAPKIVKNGDGSSLMKDINLASEIIKACVRSTDKPITVKFRKGFNIDDDFLVEFAKMCEDSGASAITVHPRTRAQMFTGEIDPNDIKKVKEAVKIPVIANGDVVDYESYKNMLSSGCDGVMIGRASYGNPQIFNKLLGIENQVKISQVIKEHLVLLKQYFRKDIIVKSFKKHALYYLNNFKGSNEVKRNIVLLNDLEEMEKTLLEFVESNEQ